MVRKKKKDFTYGRPLSAGIFVGAIFFLVSVFGKILGIFPEFINLFLDLYGFIGYDFTYFGSILILIYGFLTGFLLNLFYYWLNEKLV
jgi:hypothetical protein